MMYKKVVLFKDDFYAALILNSRQPKDIKALGRKIHRFDSSVWDKHKLDIVIQGNYLKFSQNSELKAYLQETGSKILVEASPYDTVWGIGMKASEKGIENPENWKGENLLGIALMEVRDKIRNPEE